MIVSRLRKHFETHNERSDEPDLPLNEKLAQWRERDGEFKQISEKEMFVGVEDLDEQDLNSEDIQTNLPSYRDFVIGTPPYRWLLSRIQRDITMSVASPDIMRSISDQILVGLSRSNDAKNLSRSQGPHICSVGFSIDWLLLKFLRDQGYQERPEDALGKVITLTGTATNAQALTTEQYIQQTWPLTGIRVLEALKDAVRQETGEQNRSKQGKSSA